MGLMMMAEAGFEPQQILDLMGAAIARKKESSKQPTTAANSCSPILSSLE
jgi:hypothetical protein